jgi:NAD-dependent SIR2 family protein deacetylase
MSEGALNQATEAIRKADAMLIGAGAGFGVDSGLPDFRGDEGFWKAYPPMEKLGISFEEMANPRWFEDDPSLAWGFYGHRHKLYRDTIPHAGFEMLRRWAESMKQGAFVYTSNVDGHFQRMGFGQNRILECHGSLNYFQCLDRCGQEVWRQDNLDLSVDEGTLRASTPFPACPSCGSIARPNILMFGDWGWDSFRTEEQRGHFMDWVQNTRNCRTVTVEIGAGVTIPSVRNICEQLADETNGTLIRINPRDPQGTANTISIPLGGLEALRQINELMP